MFKEEKKTLEKLLFVNPSSIKTRFAYAELLFLNNNILEAKSQFEILLKKDLYKFENKFTSCICNLCDIYLDYLEFKSAIYLLEDSLVKFPNNSILLLKLGEVLFYSGKDNKALDILSKINITNTLLFRLLKHKNENQSAINIIDDFYYNNIKFTKDVVSDIISILVDLNLLEKAQFLKEFLKENSPSLYSCFVDRFNAINYLLDNNNYSKQFLHPHYESHLPHRSKTILVIGTGTGMLAKKLRELGSHKVYGFSFDKNVSLSATALYDEIIYSFDEILGKGLYFNTILFGDSLAILDKPSLLFKQLEPFLLKDTLISFVIHNMKNYTLLGMLADGCFNYDNKSLLKEGTKRLFTRKSASNFINSLGLDIFKINDCLDPIYTKQIANSNRKEFNLGAKVQIDFNGLDETELKEYFIISYFFSCKILNSNLTAIFASNESTQKISFAVYIKNGLTYLEKHKFDLAESEFIKALDVNPKSGEVYSHLGLIAWYRGSMEDAFFLFKQSINVDPFFEDAYFNLYDASKKVNSTDEALNIIILNENKNKELIGLKERILNACDK